MAAAGVEHELVDDLGARRGAHDVERGLARRHVDARVAVARAVRAGHRVRPEAEARLLRAVDVHARQSEADAAPELRAVGPVLRVVLRRRNRLVHAVRAVVRVDEVLGRVAERAVAPLVVGALVRLEDAPEDAVVVRAVPEVVVGGPVRRADFAVGHAGAGRVGAAGVQVVAEVQRPAGRRDVDGEQRDERAGGHGSGCHGVESRGSPEPTATQGKHRFKIRSPRR